MRLWFLVSAIVGTLLTPAYASDEQAGLSVASIEHATTLRDALISDSHAWPIVESLTTEVGPRLAGTESESRAREWALKKLAELGFENVHAETFELEGWERGAESAALTAPYPQPLEISTLGGSVATPDGGVEASVSMFRTLDELRAAPVGSLNGRIAFVSHAMQKVQMGMSYGEFRSIRTHAASIAASKGAVAALIRSIGTDQHRFAHTGTLSYADDSPKIPAAALSNPDADQLERILNRGQDVRVRLELKPRATGKVVSGNIIADIVGRDAADEIVIISAHLDSWDIGTGAVDDGAGVAIATAAAKAILDAGKQPRRTIRLILWGAEEVGLKGAHAYLSAHATEIDKHIVGTESDFGAEKIWQLSSNAEGNGQAVVEQIAKLLLPIGITAAARPSSMAGPDVSVLVGAGMGAFGFAQNGMDYFDLHHTKNDTLDKINPSALNFNAAAFAVFAWLAADSDAEFR